MTDTTPQRREPPARCADPQSDNDPWVLWSLLAHPLDRLCHVLMATLLAQSYAGRQDENRPPILFDQGLFWIYDASTGAWGELKRVRIEQRMALWSGHRVIASQDKTRPISLTSTAVHSIMRRLEVHCTPHAPVFDSPRQGIAFGNGFLSESFELEEHQHTNFARWSIPCAYEDYGKLMGRGCYDGSMFARYWSTVFNCDEHMEKMTLVGQHMFAALSGTATYYGRALLLKGSRGSGKSQALEMYENLVPKDAVCSISPQQMETEYHGAELIGKALNVVYEMSQEPIKNEAGYKSIVQGELICRRRIRESPAHFRPVCAHAGAANGYIPVINPSMAYWDRWMVVQFPSGFRDTDQEIKKIGKRIATEELNLLVAWVVACGRSLVSAGRYALTREHDASIEEWQHRGDSVALWMHETCEKATGARCRWLLLSDAFKQYEAWARCGNFDVPDRRAFKKRLEILGCKSVRSSGTRVPIQQVKK